MQMLEAKYAFVFLLCICRKVLTAGSKDKDDAICSKTLENDNFYLKYFCEIGKKIYLCTSQKIMNRDNHAKFIDTNIKTISLWQ